MFPYVIPPALGFVVYVCLALTAFVEGSRNLTRLYFAGFCLFGALINIDIVLVSTLHDKSVALQIDRGVYVFFVFCNPVYIGLVHVFLGLSRKWLERFSWAVSIVFLFFTQTDLFISGLHEYGFGAIAKAGPLYHVFFAASATTFTYCQLTLFRALKGTKENRQKNRIKYMILGMGTSIFLIALNYLPVSGFNIYPVGNFGFIPAIILAFGILKYDLLDIDAAFRKGMIYIFLTGSLVIIYVFLFYTLDYFFKDFARNHSLFCPVLFALAVIFLFDPVKKGAQNFTDRHFFLGKYDYRTTLKTISSKMTLLLRQDDIRHFVEHSIRDAIQAENACLVTCRDNDERSAAVWGSRWIADALEMLSSPLGRDSNFKRFLPEKRKEELDRMFDVCNAVILFPVLFGNRLSGIITLGEKNSGELFVHEDLELMSTVANQCAVALENARVYEEIEDLNTNLEIKVRNRTAELEEALQEKERTQIRLIQSERLAAIGELVAGVAHEINNPLASSLSLVQTSLEALSGCSGGECDDHGTAEIINDLEFTMGELERMRDIVRSLLVLSRQTPNRVEPVDLNGVIEDALRILHNQYKCLDIVIHKNFQRDLPEIEGNYANLGQVVVNIIKNAVQALPEGKGNIWLTTRAVDEEVICFECRDDGFGILPENMKNIFQPFFTTKEAGEGTGLGLFISHEIVRRHGGQIIVSSSFNEGSIFKVRLQPHPDHIKKNT